MVKKKFLVPKIEWEVGPCESWLEHMAREGWMLEEQKGRRALFREITPLDCRVRLEPVPNCTQAEEDERRELYRELGWQFAATLHGYYVYYCSDPHAPEIHTDPVALNWERRKALRKEWLSLFAAIGLNVFWFLWTFRKIWGKNGWWAALIGDGGIVIGLLLLIVLNGVYTYCTSFWKLRRLRREAKEDRPVAHTGNWKRGIRKTVWDIVYLWLLIGMFFGILWWESRGAERHDIAQIPLTYIHGEELDPAFAMEEGWYTYNRSFLAPEQYAVTEKGFRGNRFYMKLDRVRFSILAEPLYEEYIAACEAGETYEAWYTQAEFTPLSHPGFDRADLWSTGEQEVLYLRKDGVILRVYLNGFGGAAEHLDDYAQMLENFS